MEKKLEDFLLYHGENDIDTFFKYSGSEALVTAKGLLTTILHKLHVDNDCSEYLLFKLGQITDNTFIMTQDECEFLFEEDEFRILRTQSYYPDVKEYVELNWCHRNCIIFAYNHPEVKGHIVVGEVNPFHGKDNSKGDWIFHVWIEDDKYVIDPTYNMKMLKKDYLKFFENKPITKLSTSIVHKEYDVLKDKFLNDRYYDAITNCVDYLIDHDNFVKENNIVVNEISSKEGR